MSINRALGKAAGRLLDSMKGGIPDFPQYTRPDAIENLRKGGVKPKMDRKPRTIQGPLPPRLKSGQGRTKYKSKEEAVMAGDKYYSKDGTPMEIRNYGSYKGGYTGGSQTKATRKDSLVTSTGRRKTDAEVQTPEGKPGFNYEGPGDPNIQAHHRAGLKMYRPFFEGLSQSERNEMIAFLETRGVFSGNQPGNRMDLSTPVHQKLHDYLRNDTDVEYSATKLAKKLNFKGMSFEERLKHLDEFVNLQQRMMDEKTYSLRQEELQQQRKRK